MELEKIIEWIINNRGKVFGTALGLLFSWFIIEYGFIKTFFVSICIAAGYYIGKRSDKHSDWKEIFNLRSED